MTRPLLRTVLTSAASATGLWAVAAGLLTHHLTASKIGAAVAVVGALLVFTGPADASNFTGLPLPMAGAPVAIKRPPNSYQRGGVFSIDTLPSDQVAGLCRQLGSTSADLACARGATVYMPNPCEFRGDRYADLLCHEAGHVSGWPANHPTENDR